jgi:hypothetical protein
MEVITQLDPKYTDEIASIQKQTQQDLSEIVGKAIDLYSQPLQADTPNALQLFHEARLIGWLHFILIPTYSTSGYHEKHFYNYPAH